MKPEEIIKGLTVRVIGDKADEVWRDHAYSRHIGKVGTVVEIENVESDGRKSFHLEIDGERTGEVFYNNEVVYYCEIGSISEDEFQSILGIA